MSRAPSPWQLQQAMTVLLETRRQLAELNPAYLEDEKLVEDTLEGEAPDAMAELHRLARAAVAWRITAAAVDERIAELQARKARFLRLEAQCRAGLHGALDALALKRLNLPDLDVVIAAPGQPAIVITDDTKVPEDFRRSVTVPDKALIREALLAGEAVPGAELSNPRPGLRIRPS